MAASTEHRDQPIDPDVLDAAEHAYPKDWLYVKVAVVLAVITAVEVMTYVTPDWFGGEGSVPFVISLLAMMALKFFAVAYWFMHLKWDNKLLTWAFYSGVILALSVYVAVLLAFRVFWPEASAV